MSAESEPQPSSDQPKIPILVTQSTLSFNRSQLINTVRPKSQTITRAAQLAFKVCHDLLLNISNYTTCMLYLQRFLIMNPHLIHIIQSSEPSIYNIESVTAGCLITAILTENRHQHPDDIIKQFPSRLDIPIIKQIQREIVESLGFDFRNDNVHQWVVKFAKTFKLDEDAAYTAYKIATDSYETTSVIQFPAHAVACACVNIAQKHHDPSFNISKRFIDDHKIGIVGVRTSTRLLLEYYGREDTKPHAYVDMTNMDFRNWLKGLQKNQPVSTETHPIYKRDPELSANGIIRYRFA